MSDVEEHDVLVARLKVTEKVKNKIEEIIKIKGAKSFDELVSKLLTEQLGYYNGLNVWLNNFVRAAEKFFEDNERE